MLTVLVLFKILGICLCCSHFSRVFNSFDWSSMPDDSNVIFLNFEETSELSENVMKISAKLAVAVSKTEAELLDFPLGARHGTALTLVLYNILDTPNDSVVVQVLEKWRSFRSLNVLIFVLPSEADMDKLRDSLKESTNDTADFNHADVYFLALGNTSVTIDTETSLDSNSLQAVSQPLGLYELYAIKSMVFLVQLKVDRVVGLHAFLGKVGRRRNFNGAEIVAVAQRDEAIENEVTFTKDSNYNHAKFEDGSAVMIYRDLRDELNFTEKAMIGSVVGLVNNNVAGRSYELLANGTADLSVSQVSTIPPRAKVFSYLQPTLYGSGVLAIFIQPPLNSMRNIYIAPFTEDVWITLIIVVAIIIAFMMFLSYTKMRLPSQKCNTSGQVGSVDSAFLGDAYIWAIGAMCQKGWPRQPCASSMRIVFLIGSLTGLIVYISYSATIISVLSVEHTPIKEITDLFGYQYSFYAHEYSSTMQEYLKAGVIDRYHLTQKVLTVSTEDEVNILLSSQNALLSYGDIFYSAAKTQNISERFLCSKIAFVPASLYSPKSAMFVLKGSPLKEYFDHKIIGMRERGLNYRYLKVYTSKTQPKCPKSSAAQTQHLNFTDVYIAFVILAAGTVLSLLVVTFERAQFGRKRLRHGAEERPSESALLFMGSFVI